MKFLNSLWKLTLKPLFLHLPISNPHLSKSASDLEQKLTQLLITPYSGTLTLDNEPSGSFNVKVHKKLYQKIVAEVVYNCFRSPFHLEQCEPLYWVQKQVYWHEFAVPVQNICVNPSNIHYDKLLDLSKSTHLYFHDIFIAEFQLTNALSKCIFCVDCIGNGNHMFLLTLWFRKRAIWLSFCTLLSL